MSRLIHIFAKNVSMRGFRTEGTPLFCVPTINGQVIGKIPTGGVYAEFITAFQHTADDLGVIGWVPGNSISECYRLFAMDHSGKPWIKVLCQEMIGWILLDHVDSIFEFVHEIEEEKQVYPYSPENWQ